MQIAIITGASSGLGRQCTAYADRQGLDEIWLLARRRDRLEEVAAGLTTQARVIALDLTEEASWQRNSYRQPGRILPASSTPPALAASAQRQTLLHRDSSL